MLAGFPRKEIDALPTLLGLVGFDVVWDDWGVCDGVGGLFDGGFAAILDRVSSRVDALVASKASTALELALVRAELPQHLVRDHVACDTMFDTVTFFMALQSMNWPQVSVVGPLPQTQSTRMWFPGCSKVGAGPRFLSIAPWSRLPPRRCWRRRGRAS